MKGFSIPLLATLLAFPAAAQVFTVTPEGVDAKYLEFKPTNVQLSTLPLTGHDREELLRFLQSEQGFSMRPLPIATLQLQANGEMKPNGSDYANLIHSKGLAAKAGERVIVTNVTIEKDHILLDFNGGPVHKHRILRHISIGMDPSATNSIVKEDPNEAKGSRIELIFPHGVPEVTGMQVEDLVKPIVDFSVKTPLQAYTDTLPPFLRTAILQHHVLVGMNHEMVLSALGQPKTKMREMENQQNVEIWIFGDPPQPTQFVRFVGNRVIRLEVARVGEPIEVHAQNEMGDYWTTQQPENARIVKLGDESAADAARQTASKPPTLRNPGETLPADNDKNTPQLGPVEMPKDTGTGGPQSAPGTQQQGTQQQGTQQPEQQQSAPQQPTQHPQQAPSCGPQQLVSTVS